MIWTRSHRFDRRALELADRHYSRQQPGTDQFVRPGSCAVFFASSSTGKAVWVTVWQRFPKHPWPGAWECAMFRNEGAGLASGLIVDAVAATRAHYGEPPADGMITFVDPAKVERKRQPGRVFLKAGFELIACMLNGLLVFRMAPDRMPAAAPLAWAGPSLFGEVA